MLTIRIPPADRRRVTTAIGEYGKQARFAFALALNGTARAIVDATRAEIPTKLTVRTPRTARFLASRVRIPRGATATRDNPSVTIEVNAGDAITGRSISLIATLAGVDAEKRASSLGPLAVPTGALGRPGSATIPLGLYPKNLRVLERRDIGGGLLGPTTGTRTRGRARVRKGQLLGIVQQQSGKWVIRGKARTFALDPRYHRGNLTHGVYQRTGPKPSDIRLLWLYLPTVPVRQRIPFQRIADETTRRVFTREFQQGLARALRTARP